MRLLTILFAMFFATGLFGQQNVLDGMFVNTPRLEKKDAIEEIGEEMVKGSQYFNNNFINADVVNYPTSYPMRYNPYTDEIEFEVDGTLYDLDKTNHPVVEFTGVKRKYVAMNYNDGTNPSFGYLLEISKGKNYSLYKREKIIFVPKVESKTGMDAERPAEFRPVQDLYLIKLKNGNVIPVIKSKKKFLKSMGEDEKRTEEFIKKNKINLNKESDLVSLVTFLNQN